jgi:hypothetical protein
LVVAENELQQVRKDNLALARYINTKKRRPTRKRRRIERRQRRRPARRR